MLLIAAALAAFAQKGPEKQAPKAAGASNKWTPPDVTGFGVAYRFGETSHLHLIERFTRIDANTINYEVTVDDPTTFTRQWTASIPMVQSDARLYE